MSLSDPVFWAGYDAIKSASRRAGQWQEYAGELEDALKVEKAHSAGLLAQAASLKEIVDKMGDPTSINEEIEEKHARGPKKGRNKTKLAKIYDKAFDEEAIRQGITNPAAQRS